MLNKIFTLALLVLVGISIVSWIIIIGGFGDLNINIELFGDTLTTDSPMMFVLLVALTNAFPFFCLLLATAVNLDAPDWLGGILASFVFFGLGASGVGICNTIEAIIKIAKSGNSIGEFILGAICPILAIISLTVMVYYIAEIKDYNSKKAQAPQELEKLQKEQDEDVDQTEEYEQAATDAEKEAEATELILTPLIEFFPEKYRTDEAVVLLLEYAETGRADSLKEALNLYEQYLHMKRQERIMEHAVDAAYESSAALEAAMRDVEKAQRDVEKAQRDLQREVERIDYENKNYPR